MMHMEVQEDVFMGSNDLSRPPPHHIIKGKRTKRQRSSSSSSSSGCYGENYCGSISSPTPSPSDDQVYESTEEEEDMANCLILLAQGEGPKQIKQEEEENNCRNMEKICARKLSDLPMTTTATTKASFYVYECKTCNRSFPSFQALGGHRASHKKPKSSIIEEKKATSPILDDLDDCHQLNKSSTASPDHHQHLQPHQSVCNKGFLGNNNKAKIHECSICGSEFNSGQALGGHMRRHRTNNTITNTFTNKNQVAMVMSTIATSVTTITSDDNHIKPRNILPLDLNLPAPEDDHHHRESKFQQALVFSAPALVDCHY